MGMNLQMALGQRRFLLLHAGAVERDGRALLMTGESGAGKSTLSALLGERGWRFMGDEFALLDLDDGRLHPFPRAVSLKNDAPELFADVAPDRLGPVLEGTPKGRIRHLRPNRAAIAGHGRDGGADADPFPPLRRGPCRRRPVGAAELFMRLTQASTNYVALGRAGFDSLLRLCRDTPAQAIDYASSEEAVALVERLWDAAQ
jgi:HprK-related kinase A